MGEVGFVGTLVSITDISLMIGQERYTHNKSIKFSSAIVEGVGLQLFPSYSSNRSTGTDAGSHPLSEVAGSGSGAIFSTGFGLGSGLGSGSSSVAGHRYRWCLAVGGGWSADFLPALADRKRGTIVEKDPFHLVFLAPWRLILNEKTRVRLPGKTHAGLCHHNEPDVVAPRKPVCAPPGIGSPVRAGGF